MATPLVLEMAKRLGEALLGRGEKLVTAESCTGGGLAHVITAVAGSSQWFERGFVTYSNASKRELLDVPAEVLERFGAVSEQTAAAMAEGAIAHSHADLAVAITGIAGPDGGSPDKPVGTVCIGWSRRDGDTTTTRALFKGDREQVRDQSIMMALQGLLEATERN